MIRFIAKLAHPFAPFPYIAGQFYSPLDAETGRVGVAQVEAVFPTHDTLRRITSAYRDFFGDEEAERALMKAYQTAFEQRLRAIALRVSRPEAHGFDPIDVPEAAHPLDPAAAAALSALDARARRVVRQPGIVAKLWHVERLIFWALALMGSAIWIALRHGRSAVAPRVIRVLAPDSGHESRWQPLIGAAERAGLWRRGSIVIEALGARPRYAYESLPVLPLARIRVPRTAWLREVAWPSCKLAARLMAIALPRARDPIALEVAGQALNLAAATLPYWRVALTTRLDYWLDDAEHDARHIIRGIMARKAGGVLARLPHADPDTSSSQLSFLGYDIFITAGPYQARAFGSTWRKACRIASIGPIKHDPGTAVTGDDWVINRDAIQSRLAQGKRMAVFFGPSRVAGYDRWIGDAFDSVCRGLAGRDDWFLVAKGKLEERMYRVLEADARYPAWRATTDIVFVRYPEYGRETCPPGWLMERMAFGFGGPGSIAVECLTAGKPLYCYLPFIEPTEMKRVLHGCGLLHATPDGAAVAIRRFAETPDPSFVPFDWFRESFNPFSDHTGLTRLAHLLLGAQEQADATLCEAAA